MADGEMRPQSDSSGPAGAHYRADDDIELPPIDDATAGTAENGLAMSKSPGGGLSSLLGSAVLLGAVLVGAGTYGVAEPAKRTIRVGKTSQLQPMRLPTK